MGVPQYKKNYRNSTDINNEPRLSLVDGGDKTRSARIINKNNRSSTDKKNKPRLSLVNRPNKIRHTRINDDWQYLNEPKLSAHPTADEIFNASYKDRGIRPKDIRDKEQAEKVADLNERREQRKKRRIINKNIHNKTSSLKSPTEVSIANKRRWRARATKRALPILYSYTSVYLTLQLPFAIFGLAMLGTVATVQHVVSTSTTLSAIEKGISGITSSIGKGTDYIGLTDSASTGISITGSLTAIPLSIYLLTFVIIFTFGILSLLGTLARYESARFRPLSGEHGGLKIGTFLIVIIGYSVPVLNIFPWLLVWMFVVWKYPR